MRAVGARARQPMRRLGRSVGLYVMLVGVPFVGVVLVLGAGGRLDAPPVVAGTWTVRVEGPPRPGLPCGVGEPGRWRVGQSGTFVRLEVGGGVELRARLVGDTVTAEEPSGCAGRPVGVRAVRARSARGELAGELWVGACPACERRRFEATRIAPIVPAATEGGR